MSAYIDATYYNSTYFGKSAGTEFDRLAARASDDVDIACLNQIVLADLDEVQLSLLKKAVAAQIEYYVVNGDEYNESGVSGESIGSFSTSGARVKNPASLCPRSMAYLEQTGLMFRGMEAL